MQQIRPEDYRGPVYFVYDGECPICSYAAHALRIQSHVGPLHLVNARENYSSSILAAINARGLDLDAGMVLVLGDSYYHGAEALELMARLGAPSGLFNRINALLFRNRFIAATAYPLMRSTRNALIRLSGTPNLKNLQAAGIIIFKPIFGAEWDKLPTVMQKHYAVRSGSADEVRLDGALDVRVSLFVRLLAKLTGMLVPYAGERVPVTVLLSSSPETRALHFDRAFHFPSRQTVHFRSRMQPVGGNELVEWMRFGLGWRCAYTWDGSKVVLAHRGYVLRLLSWHVLLPLEWVLGRGYAEEVPLGEDSFAMWTHTLHPWFGETFRYGGEFKITEVTCSQS